MSQPKLVPVDGDPFAAPAKAAKPAPKLTPVAGDPFAAPRRPAPAALQVKTAPAARADIAKSTGFFDRVGDFLSRGGAAVEAGLFSAGSALQDLNKVQLPWVSDEAHAANLAASQAGQTRLRTDAALSRATAATPIQNETTWEQVKAKPNLANVGSFVAEGGVQSLPGMAAAILAAPAYLGSQIGNIGQQRAENDGRENITIGDAAVASPAAALSVALERFGASGIIGSTGRNAAVRIGKSAATEGLTEAAQTALEYTGGTLGTEKGMDAGDLANQVAAASLIGTGVGGAGSVAMETGKAGVAALPKKQAAPDVIAPTLTPVEGDPFQTTPEAAPAPAPVAVAPQPVEPPPAPQSAGSEATVQPIDAGDDGLGQAAPGQKHPLGTSYPLDGGDNMVIGQTPEGNWHVMIQNAEKDDVGGWDDFAGPEVSIDEVRALAMKKIAEEGYGQERMADPVPEPAPEPAPQPKPEPAPAPAPPPAEPVNLRPEPGPVGEGERTVRTPAGASIRTRMEVVDASTLKQAEGDNQNRDRSRDTTTLQVQDIVSKFDPELLGEDPSSDRGAPIVGDDNSVDSGNGRMLALNTIYQNHPELAAKYRAMIEGKGFSTEGMDRPVLVQRRLTEFTPEQRRQFVIDSNKDTKLELSPVERARSDADSLTPEMLAVYAGGDLNSTANAGFVQSFNSRLTTGEMGNMVGSDRRLTPAGQQRIENAVVAHAYGEPKLLERMMESSQDEIRSITGSLADVAGPWARLRADVKAGDIDASYDVTKQLTDAAARVADARKRGIKPADILTQADAFDPIDPLTAEFIRAFHNTAMTRSASRKAVSEFLRDFIAASSEQDATPGLFGEVEAQSPVSIAKTLLEKRDNPNGEGMLSLDPKENTDDLYVEGQKPRVAGGNRGRVDAKEGEDAPAADAGRVGNDAPARIDSAATVDEAVEDRGGYTPSHAEASFTNRQSVYDSAIRATGLTNDQFNLLPPARKVKLLTDALKKLTGISASLTEKMPLQHAIDQLLDAHQTLQGMANALGIAPQALSLKGQLKLQLVKSARFLGAFYPGLNLIKLPGRSNSFAHEWAHALDWHLLNMLTPSEAKGLTGEIRNNGTSFQPGNVREAFVHLLNTMFFDGAGLAAKTMKLEQQIAATKSDKQRALLQAQIDRIFDGSSKAKEKSRYWKGANAVNTAGGDSGYWTRPTEMFARAFEAWIAFKVEAEGLGTEFIAKGDERYSTPAAAGFNEVYPQDAERMAIFDAMQKMMDAVNAEALLGATPRSATDFDAVATPAMKVEADKVERKTRGLLNRLIGPDIEAWQIGRENARIDALDSKARAPDPVRLLSKANNVRSLAFSAASDGVKMVATRWNSKAALAIHDQFQSDLGGTRRVARTWDASIEIRENKAFNPIFKLLEEHGSKGWVYKKLDPKQRDTLHRLLLGETVADDMGMTKLASAMRRVFNDEWYENKNAGIDLGYVRDTAYLNRQTDRELVAAQPDKFAEQATLVYELVFDRDVGADADEIAGDADRLANFMAIAKQHKIEGLKELRAALREAGKETDPDAEPDPEAVTRAIEEMYDEVRNAYAITAASEYRDAILHTETFPDFTATSTLPDSEKRRSLPPEADELLKDFYNPDPISSFMQYVSNSVRRTEWAKRFGPAGEKGKALDEQMAREGVPEADRRYVWSLVDRMSGRYKRTGWLANPGVAGTLALLRVKGTLAMMGRAVTLSFFEPMSMGIVSGRPMDGLRAVATTWAIVLHKGTRAEKLEWARSQGFIKHHMLEQIRGMDRFGTTSDTPSRLDRLPSAMFRNTGLTFLTDASIAAVAHVGRQATIDAMAHRVANGGARGKEATNLMRELGIRDPDEMAKQIVALNGATPSQEWLAGPEGLDYNTALFRLTTLTIQRPGAAELAPLGRNPLASYATYSITAFLQSAYRNLLKRQAKIGLRLAKAGEAEVLARFLAGTLSSVVLLYAFNSLASVAREMLFNPDRQEEWEKDGEWWSNNMALAASRTFSFGALDPVVNASTGLKYNRDLAYLPLGAYAGNDAQNLTKMAKVFYSNSRVKNTAEHNALQGFYGFAISPMLAAGASLIPPGPFGMATGGFVTSTGTSPQAAKAFASAIVGPKDTPKTKTPTAFDRGLEAAFGPKEKKPAPE